MEQILRLKKEEQAQYFQEAAARSNNIKAAIIFEKDFWVCWALQQIFTIPAISPHITFKGGTSLSKCYNIINRFSEDCDLTLSKSFLEINIDAETIANSSKSKKEKAGNELSMAVINKVKNDIKPLLINKFKEILDPYFKDTEWKIEIDPSEEQNLLFHYPTINNKNDQYIQSIVKLEFGGRGDNNPNEVKMITPFIYQTLPGVFDTIPSISIPTLTVQRTFWEKITLLHAEHHRGSNKPPKARMFRHYYDVAMLDQYGITQLALNEHDLLKTIVTNKKAFFYTAWANYDTANIGSIQLLPNNEFIHVLKKDYENMSDMFFGTPPVFDDIINHIEKLEKTINQAGS